MAHVWAFAGLTSLVTSLSLSLTGQDTIAKFMWPKIPQNAKPYPKMRILLAEGKPNYGNHTLLGGVIFPFVFFGVFLPLRIIPGAILTRVLSKKYGITKPIKQYQSISSSLYGSCPKIFVNTFFASLAFPIATYFKIQKDGPGIRYDPGYYEVKQTDVIPYRPPLPTGDFHIETPPVSIIQVTSPPPLRPRGR